MHVYFKEKLEFSQVPMKDKGQRTRDGGTEDGKKSSKEQEQLNIIIWSHWDSVLSKRLALLDYGRIRIRTSD